MRILTALGFAAAGVFASGLGTAAIAANDKAKTLPASPCQELPQSKLVQEPPVDLSGSGLKFDPRAPGGAQPVEARPENVPVDPGAIVIFPSTPKLKTNGEQHEKIVPCP